MSESMAGIDGISHAIGSLEKSQETLESAVKDHHAITNAKLDKIIDGMAVLGQSTQTAHSRLDRVEATANDYTVTKRRGIMALIGIGAAGGAGSTGIMKMVAALLGGGQ